MASSGLGLPDTSEQETEAILAPSRARPPNDARQSVSPDNSEVQLDARDCLEAVVSVIRDDLHVERLRQVWDIIRSRLDERPTAPDARPLLREAAE